MSIALCNTCKKNFQVKKQTKGLYCSYKCYWINMKGKDPKHLISVSGWNKGLIMPKMRGKNHPKWKGGTGSLRHQLMGKIEYKLWRKAVFERDNYTCRICFKRGGRLEADHIKPWSLFPELRYAIDNGRTLCVKCHRTTDTWGYRVFKSVES